MNVEHPEVEQALARVRAKLAALHELAAERDGHMRRHAFARARVMELNERIAAARGEYLAARADAAAAMLVADVVEPFDDEPPLED